MSIFKNPIKGTVAHGSAAGFGFIRSIRSRFHHRYHEKYKPKYKRARLIFAIDGFFLGLVALLIGFNLYLLAFVPPESSDINLTLLAPPIETAKPIALEAKMSVKGESAHENVVLDWSLPEGVEILQATPPINAEGRANIGRLEPGEEVSAKIVLRLFTDEPQVTFGFHIHEDTGTFAGGMTRPVVGSGLKINPFIDATLIARGASIPYLLENETSLDIQDISIVATDGGRVQEADQMDIEKLASLERRFFLFRPIASDDGFEIRAHGKPLYRVHPEAEISSNPLWSNLNIELAPSTGSGTRVSVETPEPFDLLVYHPGLMAEDHAKMFKVDPEVKTIPLRVDRYLAEDAREWFALPILTRDNAVEIGPVSIGTITTNFDANVQARFYAASGDQLGVGSLPPEVGEEITFWILPRLEPVTADLRDFRLEMRLADHVELTGNQALPHGGELEVLGNSIIWSHPYIARTDASSHAAFEVRVIPTEDMRGAYIPFITEWSAEAVEIRSGVPLEDSGRSVDSALPQDDRGAGSGRVR